MPFGIDVFCAWAKLGIARNFESSRVVFEDLAQHLGLSSWNIEPQVAHLLEEVHHRDDVAERGAQRNKFTFA